MPCDAVDGRANGRGPFVQILSVQHQLHAFACKGELPGLRIVQCSLVQRHTVFHRSSLAFGPVKHMVTEHEKTPPRVAEEGSLDWGFHEVPSAQRWRHDCQLSHPAPGVGRQS